MIIWKTSTNGPRIPVLKDGLQLQQNFDLLLLFVGYDIVVILYAAYYMQILHVCIQLLPGKNPESRNKFETISANPQTYFCDIRCKILVWSPNSRPSTVRGLGVRGAILEGPGGLSVMIIPGNRDMSNPQLTE